MTAGASRCKRANADLRHTRRTLRDQERQEVGVEDRAGAVAERVELDLAFERLPQLRGQLSGQPRATAVAGRVFGALLHLAPDRLSAGPRERLDRRIRQRPRPLAPIWSQRR